MKDETCGKAIQEFIGLRSKMYSFCVDGHEKKTAKGIKRNVIRQKLCHAAYRDVLFNENVTRETMNLIRSFKHKIFSVICNKLSLSSFDDKRYVLEDKINTRAHGHFLNHLEDVIW